MSISEKTPLKMPWNVHVLLSTRNIPWMCNDFVCFIADIFCWISRGFFTCFSSTIIWALWNRWNLTADKVRVSSACFDQEKYRNSRFESLKFGFPGVTILTICATRSEFLCARTTNSECHSTQRPNSYYSWSPNDLQYTREFFLCVRIWF